MNWLFWEHAERIDFNKETPKIKINKLKTSEGKTKIIEIKKVNNGKSKK